MIQILIFLFAMLCSPQAWGGSVDLNTATAEELDSLPGIGPSKAQAIIDDRTRNGPFAHVDDITRVSGIGPATLANIRSLVEIASDAPTTATDATTAPNDDTPTTTDEAPEADPTGRVDINTASASALESMTGIGPSKARSIIEDRDANGPYASCADLTRVSGIGEVTVMGLQSQCSASQ